MFCFKNVVDICFCKFFNLLEVGVMVFHVDGVSGVPVVCLAGAECGLFHLGSVEEFDGLFECYHFYVGDCHLSYMQACLLGDAGFGDVEDYREVSFEEFCVSGLWVDYMYAPCIDEVGEVVDESSETDDWDVDDVPW